MSSKIIPIMTTFVVVLGGATVYGVYSGLNNQAQEAVEHLAQKIEAQGDGRTNVTYGTVTANIMGRSVTVKDVEFNTDNGGRIMSMASVDLSAEGYEENKTFPTSVDVAVTGLDVANEGVNSSFNRGRGSDYLKHIIDGSLGYHFDKENDVLKAYFNLAVPEMNDIAFNATMSNIKGVWNDFETNYAENEGKLDFEHIEGRSVRKMMGDIRMNGLTLDYTNKGEVDKVLEQVASSQGITIDELQVRMPDMINGFLGDAPFASVLGVFLANPKTLSVSYAPETPVTPREMGHRFQMLSSGYVDEAIEDGDFKLVVNNAAD